MKMKRILIMMVIAVLCSSMFPTIVVHAQTTPDVSLVPSTSTPKIFDTFTVNITVSNVEDLWTWQAGLQWDPNVLNFTSFTFTEGLTGNWMTLVIQPSVTNNVMVLPALQTEANNTGTTPLTSPGPVTLATMNFTTIALGDSTVKLTDVALNGRYQTTTTTAYNPDINRDNVDGLVDLVSIVRALQGANIIPNADVNFDGAINITDFAIVGDDYGGHVNPGSNWTSNVIYDITPTVQNCGFTVILNTPVGPDVPVSLPAVGVNLNFTSVTGSGITDVTTSNTGPPPPANFNVTGPDGEPLYYQITTTATYNGQINISVTYDPSVDDPRLMHYEAGIWTDVTATTPPVDKVNHIVYGVVYSFSIFAVMEPTPPDVAVTNATSSNTVVGQGLSTSLNVTVANQGDYAETFNVTAYANTTIIASENVTLPAGNSTTVTFAWNTTGFAYGNYTISATAGPLPSETNTTNNNFTGGVMTVTIPGDINGDLKVSLTDLVQLAMAYQSQPGDAKWNPNADIDGNGIVGLWDLVILAQHYGLHYP